MDDFLCPPECSDLSQIIIAVVIGIILSCLYVSLLTMIVFVIIIEAFIFFSLGDRYRCIFRIGLICASIFGWILGRTVYRMKTFIISEELDEKWFGRMGKIGALKRKKSRKSIRRKDMVRKWDNFEKEVYAE